MTRKSFEESKREWERRQCWFNREISCLGSNVFLPWLTQFRVHNWYVHVAFPRLMGSSRWLGHNARLEKGKHFTKHQFLGFMLVFRFCNQKWNAQISEKRKFLASRKLLKHGMGRMSLVFESPNSNATWFSCRRNPLSSALIAKQRLLVWLWPLCRVLFKYWKVSNMWDIARCFKGFSGFEFPKLKLRIAELFASQAHRKLPCSPGFRPDSLSCLRRRTGWCEDGILWQSGCGIPKFW